MPSKKRRGGIVEGILAKAKPKSPLKGIRVRTSKPSFLSRAVRPGGMAEGGTVPEKEPRMAKRFGFPASTKGAGRGEGMAALTEDQPPTVGPKGPTRPPPGIAKGVAPPPPAAAPVAGPPRRRPKPISALRGGLGATQPQAFKGGGRIDLPKGAFLTKTLPKGAKVVGPGKPKGFAEGGLVTRGDGLARKGGTKGREI